MINIILSGCSGQMGKAITEVAANEDNVCIICGFDKFTGADREYPIYETPDEYDGPCDVIIDFSNPSALSSLLSYAKRRKIPAVIATTGLSEEQINDITEASKEIPIFRSANMSLGVNLMVELAKKAAEILNSGFDIEIIEKHHNKKVDAPSGTALMLADAINETLDSSLNYVYDRHNVRKKREKNELGIHAVRGGTIVGEHDVIFAGNDEILTINHTALSKKVFAEGAVKAASFLAGCKPGIYDMKSIINSLI